MNNVLLTCLFVLLGLACSKTRSKNVELINIPQNTPEKSTTPTPNINPISDADYTFTQLVQGKMTQTTLDKQPEKVIEQILMGESTEKDKWRSPKSIKAKIENRDFNQDGNLERIIISRLYSEAGVPVLYIFSSENSVIFQRDLGIPNGDADIDIEFLTKPGKSNFDLIKLTENLGGEEVTKEITYYKMQDNQYEAIECHKIEGKTVKLVPCPT